MDFLSGIIRSVDKEKDVGLPRFSYSRLDTYKQCPYRYNLTYNQDKRSSDTSLALELGTLLHYILEQKGKMLESSQVDYSILSNILYNGTTETDAKTQEDILGIKGLKRKYWETWCIPDSEGRTYDEKIDLFLKVLSDEMENSEWKPYLFEHPFEFVYKDRVIFHGFIDRVDVKRVFDKENTGDHYRVIDYKTNKKPFDEKHLPTALQFGIYAMAVLNEFGRLPEEYLYRLILLDKTQKALTLGWEKRTVAALDKLLDGIDESDRSEYVPKPSPLCHWCNYCVTNKDAKQFSNECQYYSLWTPENKTFEIRNKWGESVNKPMRKLIF